MIKETAYETLDRVSKIKNKPERTEALREELKNNKQLAMLVQYTYHPDVKFALPPGPLPDDIAKKSRHDEGGILYNNARRLYQFKDDFNLPKTKRETNFLVLYESVASDDADLLIGIKDKKLPWKSLSKAFVKKAVPELFPPVDETDTVDEE